MAVNYIGVYWGARKETREACAQRLSSFLLQLKSLDSSFNQWLQKGPSRLQARNPIALDQESIGQQLRTNNRDITAEPLHALGFRFSAWNGDAEAAVATISVTCGAYSAAVKNCMVISFDPTSQVSSAVADSILEIAKVAFDPETARIEPPSS